VVSPTGQPFVADTDRIFWIRCVYCDIRNNLTFHSTSHRSPWITCIRKEPNYFLFADYTGVGPDFVQMRPSAGYDLVRYMPETLRVGDTR